MGKQKDKPIEKIQHGPFSITIRMNDLGVFMADYGALGTSGSLPDVRIWAKKTLREFSDLQWHPVMQVNFSDADDRVNNLRNSSNLSCYIERMWIAWTGTKWIECPWVVDRAGTVMCIGPANSERDQDKMPPNELMAQRIARSKDFFYGPKTNVIQWPIIGDSHHDKTYFVPYSEESWQTMLGILERIRELRSSINKLLGSGSGWKVLAKVAATKLLSAPK